MTDHFGEDRSTLLRLLADEEIDRLKRAEAFANGEVLSPKVSEVEISYGEEHGDARVEGLAAATMAAAIASDKISISEAAELPCDHVIPDEKCPDIKALHADPELDKPGDIFSHPSAPCRADTEVAANPALRGTHWATRLWLDEQATKKERRRQRRRDKQKRAKADRRAAKRAADAPQKVVVRQLMDYLAKSGKRQDKLRGREQEIMLMWDVRERFRAAHDNCDPSLNQYAEAWNRSAKDVAWRPASISRYQTRNHLKTLTNLDREAWDTVV
jgi:hypothetical protein